MNIVRFLVISLVMISYATLEAVTTPITNRDNTIIIEVDIDQPTTIYDVQHRIADGLNCTYGYNVNASQIHIFWGEVEVNNVNLWQAGKNRGLVFEIY